MKQASWDVVIEKTGSIVLGNEKKQDNGLFKWDRPDINIRRDFPDLITHGEE